MDRAHITKQMIADALRRLIEQMPYESITVSDIARECAISRNTFYYHFRDKQELAEWIYLDSRSKVVQPPSKDSICANSIGLAYEMLKDAGLYSQMRYDLTQNGFRETYFKTNYFCFQKMFDSYLNGRTMDPEKKEALCRYMAWAGSELYWDMCEGKISLSPEDLIATLDMFWKKGIYNTLDELAK